METQVEELPRTHRQPKLRSRLQLGTKLLLLFVAVLIAGRAYLPIWLTGYVNRTLSKIPDYRGEVKDVDLHLIRGAYTIIKPRLVKVNGKVEEPLFSADEVDLSVEWRQLWNRSLVGEIEFLRPRLTFVKAAAKANSQTKVDSSWVDRVRELFPLKINRVAISDGTLHYKQPDSSPPVDLHIDAIRLEARNLTNSESLSKTLVATADADGRVEGQAPLSVKLAIDPYAKIPTFDTSVKLEQLRLTRLNDFFRAWGNFDVERGDASMYLELASSDKKFNGYLKPILKDIHVVSLEKDDESLLNLVWQGLVATVVELFSNQRHDQFAAQIPLEGSAENPRPDSWSAILSILENAFIKGLEPKLEGTVSFRDAKADTAKSK